MCHRCQGFYRLGKGKKVLERLDKKGRVLDRKERHSVRKMMETKGERRRRRAVEMQLSKQLHDAIEKKMAA